MSARVAAVVALLGLATAALGAFALPLQRAVDPSAGGDIGFVLVRQRMGDNEEGAFGSGFGEFWWRYGLFLALALLLAGVCLLVLGIAARVVGVAVAVLGILALAGQGAALAQTFSLAEALPAVCRRPGVMCSFSMAGSSLYDHAAAGIWVAYAGLFVVVAGGLLAALTGRRRVA